jgi:hypothetical protein
VTIIRKLSGYSLPTIWQVKDNNLKLPTHFLLKDKNKGTTFEYFLSTTPTIRKESSVTIAVQISVTFLDDIYRTCMHTYLSRGGDEKNLAKRRR